MLRTGTAVWRGNGLEGKGVVSMQSGAVTNQPYSFHTRFVSEDGMAGTNPEELLAASHSSCFTMAVAFGLTAAGHPADELRTTAAVDLGKVDGNNTIRGIALTIEGRVSGLDQAQFQEIAEAAKKGCPISRALAATPITLTATLV
jgi:osmotically inducible protein OsmC